MAQLRSGAGVLHTCTFLILIAVCFGLIFSDSAQAGETYSVNGEVEWSGQTIVADSITVSVGSTLTIEDSLIIMNNSAPFPEIKVHGTLIMNRSKIIPLDHTSGNRFFFKVYGSCRLVDNEFIKVNSLSLLTTDVYLSGNIIKETRADGIYIQGDVDSLFSPRINENIIEDSQFNGIRLEDTEADLVNNEITNCEFDAIHLIGSEVSITGGIYDDVGRYPVYLTGNSTANVDSAHNLSDASFEFGDDNSRVYIKTDDGHRTLKKDSGVSIDYETLAILLGILALLCLGGVHLFYRWNTDKTTKGEYALPSLALKEQSTDPMLFPEYKKSEDVEAQVAFGDMAMSGGSYEAALKYYNDALEFTRSDDLLVRRGNVLEKMQLYQEAFDNYEGAYKINPMNKDAIEGMWWLRDAIANKESIPKEVEEKIYEFLRNPEERKGPMSKSRKSGEPQLTVEDESGEGGEGKGESEEDDPLFGDSAEDKGSGEQATQPGSGDEESAEGGKPVRIVQKTAGAPLSAPAAPQMIPAGMAQSPFQASELSEMFKDRSQREAEERPILRDEPLHGGGPLEAGPQRNLHQTHELGLGDGDSDRVPGDEGEEEEGPEEDMQEGDEDSLAETDIPIPVYDDFIEPLSIPGLKKDIEEIVADFDIGKLYFEDKHLLLKQIAIALAGGKHIIFYGPPGTGKSCIARDICESIGVNFAMVTGTSDWSTFDTIGGYMLGDEGSLRFSPGLFLRSCQEDGLPVNRWLIIDEINRADIDKAFGPMFSALAGDDVTLSHRIDGNQIEVIGKPKMGHPIGPHRFFIHPMWHILATLNTFDKTSLYEMSYAFMRRFSFISVQIPEDLDKAVVGLTEVWGMEIDDVMKRRVTILWEIINDYRKIGPAIVRDILDCVMETNDYTSAINMYVLPQFEGLEDRKLKRFKDSVIQKLSDVVNMNQLHVAIEDFFNTKL